MLNRPVPVFGFAIARNDVDIYWISLTSERPELERNVLYQLIPSLLNLIKEESLVDPPAKKRPLLKIIVLLKSTSTLIIVELEILNYYFCGNNK